MFYIIHIDSVGQTKTKTKNKSQTKNYKDNKMTQQENKYSYIKQNSNVLLLNFEDTIFYLIDRQTNLMFFLWLVAKFTTYNNIKL